MPRHFLLVLALGTCLSPAALADTDDEVNDKVETIIGSTSVESAGILVSFIQANEKPLATARSDLNTLIARLNEERRYDLARAVQKRVETLPDTVQKRAGSKVPVVVPTNTPLLERMVGKWNRTGDAHHYVVLENGTVEQRQDKDNKVVDTTTLTIADDETAEFKFKDGTTWRCKMAGNDAVAVFTFDASGKRHGDGIALERMNTR